MAEMTNHSRTVKILISLVAGMTAGAGLLMLLDQKAPSEGAFSLSSYTRLDPVDFVIAHPGGNYAWNRIEVFFSGTTGGNLDTLAQGWGLRNSEELNFHFVVYNGLDGRDGLIERTDRWVRQHSAMPSPRWYGSAETIRICVISDGVRATPTESQIRRTTTLVEKLGRQFGIRTEDIDYPKNWQL